MKGIVFLAYVQRAVIYGGRGISLIETQKTGGFERSDDVEYVVGEYARHFGLAEPDRYASVKKILDDVRFIGDYTNAVGNSG
jgi:hypothetical protein